MRGSSTRCNVGSSEVTETFTAAALHARELAQNIDIARDKMVLCDDRHRIAKFRKHLEAAARYLQFSLHRLIRIGHATQHQRLRLPSRRFQFGAQQLRRICFHHDFAFEIESGRKPEILVSWSRVTIDAAVLAAAIRIQACFKADIRTVITGDDRSRSVAKILRRRRGRLFGLAVDVDYVRVGQIDMQFFKSVRRAPGRATSSNGRVALRRFDDHRLELLVRRTV